MHKKDTFYDVPFKSAQLIFNNWVSGKAIPENIISDNEFIISGFLFDEYPLFSKKNTNVITTTSDIFSYTDILGKYRYQHQEYIFLHYQSYLRLYQLSYYLKRGLPYYRMKHYFPKDLIHSRNRTKNLTLLQNNKHDIIMNYASILNVGTFDKKKISHNYFYKTYKTILHHFNYTLYKEKQLNKKKQEKTTKIQIPNSKIIVVTKKTKKLVIKSCEEILKSGQNKGTICGKPAKCKQNNKWLCGRHTNRNI